jgi:hypothetical protein
MRLTPPTHNVFYISVALAVISVLLAAFVYTGHSIPLHGGGAYLVLLIGYLVLLAGNALKGV